MTLLSYAAAAGLTTLIIYLMIVGQAIVPHVGRRATAKK
jgi:hypothetical protein